MVNTDLHIRDFLYKNRMLTKTAIIYKEDRICYQELYRKAYNLGKVLKEQQIDKVILYLPNSVEYLVGYFGTLFADKIVYPISIKSKEDEIKSSLDSTECKCILTVSRYVEMLMEIIQNNQVEVVAIDQIKLDEEVESAYWNQDLDEAETCLLLNTSGSTSQHKIVMLSNKGVCINCRDWTEIALHPEKEGRILVSMPVSTSFGSVVISSCIMLGWTIIFMPDFFNIPDLLRTIEEEKVTHLISIGSALNILAMNIKRLSKSKYNVDSIEFIGIGGNKAVLATLETLGNYFKNAGMSPGYGLTEATCMVSTISPDLYHNNKEMYKKKIDSAGKAYRNCFISLYVEGRYVTEANVEGEIVISGPTIMNGYYKNIEATNAVLKEGHLHTGDMGYLDEDGYLYIIGRTKNLIKSGGYSVFPEEVETVLLNSGLVREVVVYCEKDMLLDELVVADVIPVHKNIEEQTLLDYCYHHLSEYKVPKKIRFVTEIATTKNGKIKRGSYV